jgi:hypothetical protein
MERVETLKVGNVCMMVQTVPVKIIIDTVDVLPPLSLFAEIRYRLIETDGYYIVIIDRSTKQNIIDDLFICFINESDAYSYLELYGVENGNKKT